MYAQALLLSVRDFVAFSSEFRVGRAISYVRRIAWGWRCDWILTAGLTGYLADSFGRGQRLVIAHYWPKLRVFPGLSLDELMDAWSLIPRVQTAAVTSMANAAT